MDDHSHCSDSHGHLSVPSGLTSLVARAIIAAIKSAGNPELAEKIATAPELIGTKLGKTVAALLHKKANDQILTQDDIHKVDIAVKDDPDTANLLIYSDFIRLYGKDPIKTAQRVSFYRELLMRVCDQMAKHSTSYALRGFVHESDCISYWHLDGVQPAFIGSDFIAPVDMKVFLLQKEPTTALLKMLNESIRESPHKQLPIALLESLSPASIDLVTFVSPAEPQGYSTITIEELKHLKNQDYSQFVPKADSFHNHRPMQTGTPNPPTAAMLESLAEAEAVQRNDLMAYPLLRGKFKQQ